MTHPSMGLQTVWALIPARYASRRFPGKPLATILDKPMIEHVYKRTAQASVQQVWVATDDVRIYQAVEKFGGQVIMTQSTHLCGTDRIAEALRKLTQTQAAPQWVLNVQGDEPVISPHDLNTLIRGMLKRPQAKLGTLVYPLKNEGELLDANIVKAVLDQQGRALYFSRSPIPHPRDQGALGWRHLGVYMYQTPFLQTFQNFAQTPLSTRESLEQLRVLEHGHDIYCFEAQHCGVGVDSPQDIALAEGILKEARP